MKKEPKENSNGETTVTAPDYIGHRQRLKTRFKSDLGRSMPDYEVLELLLTYALPRRDVKPLAKELIKKYKSMATVLATPWQELEHVKGVGEHVSVLLGLVYSCVNKVCWERLENIKSPILSDKKKIVEYCRSRIGYDGQEKLLVIYLDFHGKFLFENIEQTGSVNAVVCSPSTITRNALIGNASGVIIAHNHPTGDVTPSKADIMMTQQLKDALKSVQITLHDHIIISKGSYYSFREHMPFMNQR